MKPFRFRARYTPLRHYRGRNFATNSPLLGIQIYGKTFELNCISSSVDGNTYVLARLGPAASNLMIWWSFYQSRILPDSDHVAFTENKKKCPLSCREKGTRTLWTLTHSCLFVSMKCHFYGHRPSDTAPSYLISSSF
jgi:hypothetical protein